MHADQLKESLESLDKARPLLHNMGLRDAERGWKNLQALASHLGMEDAPGLITALNRTMTRCPDPDMALNNIERFLANPAGARQLSALLENRGRALEILAQLFSTSFFFSDLLALHPDYLDMVRIPLRRGPTTTELQEQLQAEVDASSDDNAVLRTFRRFRQKQILRIGTNDIIRDRPLEEITRDISRVAEVALDVALNAAIRKISKRYGLPRTVGGQTSRCVILGFGKLGGEELNYSSDIDLMFLYDQEGTTQSQRNSIANDEYYAKLVSEVVRLLSAHTDRGQAYRVDLRLRPDGQRGPLARSMASTLAYYDTMGRTWERQALIKCRPVAGDRELGETFLHAIEGFVYRKYLSFSEINEIKALKRSIEHKTHQAGVSNREVKTGHGGIRDIEFTIQFLQLLNGGDLPQVRQRNTLLAMQALERVGCLTDQEFRVLDDSYRFLRKTEHRLQLLFDLQTHRLPDNEEELRKLSLRMGYPHPFARPAPRPGRDKKKSKLEEAMPDPRLLFLRDYRDKTEPTRYILDHLLHQTFADSSEGAEPESDLILEPNPDPETIQAVLGKYAFRDVMAAYQNLTQLAQESVPFLSTRRCRHFLASIAPRLLRAVAETPDPDLALFNLDRVTESLGAKAVLWELFSFNPPCLKLYVDVCAWSQFLTEILTSNPGMIDELMDSLVLNLPRTAAELRDELTNLCRGAEDIDLILHSFQDKELLRIGVRDILGKDTIQETTAELTNLAETILNQIANTQAAHLEYRFGKPVCPDGKPSRYVLLGLGKLGGREMNYHSDLDLILIYECDGRTQPLQGQEGEATENSHYYTELAQRIIRAMSTMGTLGRLYQVDMRLRPTGKSGSLVNSVDAFRRYFTRSEVGAQLWERQTLTRARVVHGDADFGQNVMAVVAEGAYLPDWRSDWTSEILSMRQRLETSRGGRDLKRGVGGLVDIEFLVQRFQLQFARDYPALRQANIYQALESLYQLELLSAAEHSLLRDSYTFLQRVQSRLRIVHNRPLDIVPESPAEVEKLARRLGYESGPKFLAELEHHLAGTRDLFQRLMNCDRQPR